MPGLQQALPHRPLLGATRPTCRRSPSQPKLAAPAAEGRARPTSRKGIKDPELRAKVTPHFEFGCKRVLRSNTYYPALAADNIELVTDPIAKVTGNAIVTADGVEREIDVLVVATGFYTTELPITEHVTGRTGQTLADRWRETGMAAYKGTTVPEFPNLFMLVGPNTGQGHTSMVFIIESQVAYLRDALRRMRQRGAGQRRAGPGGHRPLEPQPAAADEAHRVDHRRLPELVPRRARPQHHAVAAGPPSTSGAGWRRSTPTPTEETRPEEGLRMKTLDDKVVVITGAGSGIGRALALNLARRGSLLALSDVDEAGLAETVAQARAGRRGPGAQRPARRRRPRRVRALRARRRRRSSAGSTWSSTTPASRWPATSTTSSTTTSTGSSASTSGASCTAPRSSCRT